MYIMMLSRLAKEVQTPQVKTTSDGSSSLRQHHSGIIATAAQEATERAKVTHGTVEKSKKRKKKKNNKKLDPQTMETKSTTSTTTKNKKKKTNNNKIKKDPRCQVQYNNDRPYLEEDDERYDLGVGDGDKGRLGPCVYVYPDRYPPRQTWLQDVDWFHLRNETSTTQFDDTSMPNHDAREECFLQCLNDQDQLYDGYLLAAATMGLPKVTEYLLQHARLNPLYTPPPYPKRYRINAYQAAIMGGHVGVLDKLVQGGTKLDTVVIDEWGRTVLDYISLKGSPIRPYQALQWWNVTIRVKETETESEGRKEETTMIQTTKEEYGWNTTSDHDEVDNTCHLEILDDLDSKEFFKDFYVTGRPFVLRQHAYPEEIASFSRESWQQTRHFQPDRMRHKVGPTAYPGLTGQHYCATKMTTQEILENKPCPEMPLLKMIHAEHDDYFDQAYQLYEGDPYKAGFRKLPQWFGYNTSPGWQIFMGGDGSGATLHWHAAALNILYIGIKEWRITPPAYRGFTGQTVQQVTAQIKDEPFVMKCTQRPGDMFYIPDFWGHMTVNHGFGIGVAAIVSTSSRLYMGSFTNDY